MAAQNNNHYHHRNTRVVDPSLHTLSPIATFDGSTDILSSGTATPQTPNSNVINRGTNVTTTSTYHTYPESTRYQNNNGILKSIEGSDQSLSGRSPFGTYGSGTTSVGTQSFHSGADYRTGDSGNKEFSAYSQYPQIDDVDWRNVDVSSIDSSGLADFDFSIPSAASGPNTARHASTALKSAKTRPAASTPVKADPDRSDRSNMSTPRQFFTPELAGAQGSHATGLSTPQCLPTIEVTPSQNEAQQFSSLRDLSPHYDEQQIRNVVAQPSEDRFSLCQGFMGTKPDPEAAVKEEKRQERHNTAMDAERYQTQITRYPSPPNTLADNHADRSERRAKRRRESTEKKGPTSMQCAPIVGGGGPPKKIRVETDASGQPRVVSLDGSKVLEDFDLAEAVARPRSQQLKSASATTTSTSTPIVTPGGPSPSLDPTSEAGIARRKGKADWLVIDDEMPVPKRLTLAQRNQEMAELDRARRREKNNAAAKKSRDKTKNTIASQAQQIAAQGGRIVQLENSIDAYVDEIGRLESDLADARAEVEAVRKGGARGGGK